MCAPSLSSMNTYPYLEDPKTVEVSRFEAARFVFGRQRQPAFLGALILRKAQKGPNNTSLRGCPPLFGIRKVHASSLPRGLPRP